MSLRSKLGLGSAASLMLLCGIVIGCNHADAGSPATPPAAPISVANPKPANVAETAEPPVERPKFDEKNAWAMLLKQCNFGPRPVGSDAHEKTKDFLLAEMKKYADKADTQEFTYRGHKLTNIIGVFNPEASRQILLCGHWDTRPRADNEIDPAKQRKPIIGASDGASEIAVLLELARMFKEQKPNVGVVIVFFDGEDYGSFDTMEGVLLGANYFARNHKGYKPEWGILLDMVGDKNLNIYREPNSEGFAPALNNKVFRIARELGYGKHLIDEVKTPITDDHTPLNTIGRIPTIDLIDFDYEHWHTLSDTPENCSAGSLKIVGEVVAEVVYREKAK